MMGSTAPFMVMETDIWSSGIWSKRIFMSSTESMATPALPTSPDHALVVGIVAAMRGQVEGHREALLPGRQIAPVERVRFFGGGEAGVLADGPRLHGVHGGVRAAQERRHARRVLQVLHGVQVVGRVPAASRGCARRSSRPARLRRARPARRLRPRAGIRFSRNPVSLRCSSCPSLSCHSVSVSTTSLNTWMKPCTPAACSASIWSFGLPATSTGTLTLAGRLPAPSARYSGSELHSTIRSASVPAYSSDSTMSKPAQPKKLRAEVGARALHLRRRRA